MASALDKLREHTAALQAVAAAARDIQKELEPIRSDLHPAVEKLRELNREIEKRRHDVLGAALVWSVVGGVLGGLTGGLLLWILGR